MDSMPPNEDTDEDNSSSLPNSQDINEVSINSLQNLVDDSETLEHQVECNEASYKSTFKNILQAKKRLQAFSSQRQMLTSPYAKNTVKNDSVDEKLQNEKEVQENLNLSTKSPKKDRGKAVIEEVEFKKIESLQSTPTSIDEKLLYISCKTRSRSKSSERSLLFRKREKKVRNYRRSDTSRRSPSPVISKPKKEKPSEKTNNFKFPRNWEEFKKDKWTLGKLLPKVSHSYNRNNTKDISQQLLFEAPAETIKTFFYKDDKGEEISVPYQFLRYTSSKPRVSYNVNLHNVKENYLNREQILNKTNKNYKDILEKFLSRNTRTKFRTSEPIGQRNWYQKNWKDNESKVLETSIGLSFLQNYSDDEDDEEDELTFESSSITKSQKTILKDEQTIQDTKSEVEYFDESSANTLVHKEIKMIREETKCNDCKDVQSEPSVEIHTEKINEFPHRSSVQELEIVRNRTESESFQEAVDENIDTSWTPERIEQTYDTMWDETPKKKKEKLITEKRKSKQRLDSNCENIEELQRAREIHSEDEWDETPKRKKDKFILEEENIKKSKKKKNKKRSETESSSDERQKVKRKKKKLDRRKQKEKVRKAKKKKEKLKAEKLKLKKEKKRRQKEKAKELVEKEILKKLKQEIEHNLEEVEREEWEKELNKKEERSIDKSVKVKIEKEEDYQENVRPPEDLRNFLDKKIGKVKDLGDTLKIQKGKVKESMKSKAVKKEISSKSLNEVKELTNKSQIKQETLSNEDKCKNINSDIKHKIGHPEETEEPCVMEATIENVKLNPGEIEKITTDSHIEIVEVQPTNKNKSKEDLICETTPDTDEYHSNWESDDCVSSDVKMPSKKARIEWESDEELFDRTYSDKKESDSGAPCESDMLEMPLHLQKFSSRRRNSKPSSGRQRSRSPAYLDVDSEIKLLEAERINLSKERMQLEMEKIRLRELEREKSMKGGEYIGEPSLPSDWQQENLEKKQNRKYSRWDLREDHVDSSTSCGKMEKVEMQRSRSREKENYCIQDYNNDKSTKFPKIAEVNLSSNIVSIPSSPEITSTESPKPTMLENAYQEFMRAVSTGDDSKEYLVISSADSDPPSAVFESKQSSTQKKTKRTRSERDRHREKCAKKDETLDDVKVHDITDPNLLRDILLPGEVPIEEIPMPVPSPKMEILQNLSSTIVMNVISTISGPESNSEVNTSQDSQESLGRTSDFTKKPFSFSTLVLPSKKPVLLEKSNWKLDEDSDEDAPPLKKKLEDLKDDYTNLLSGSKENLGEKVIIEPKRQIGDMKETRGTMDKKHERVVEKIEKTKDKRKDTEYRGMDDCDRKKDVEDIRKDGGDKRRDSDVRKNDVEDKKKDSEDKRKDTDDKRKDFEDKRKYSEDRRKDDRASKRRHSRSKTPPDAHKDKRRRDEDARRRDEDQRRKDEDARRRTEDARRKDEDTRRRDNDKRRKEDESKRRDSDIRKKEEDMKQKEDETKRRERDKRTMSPQRYRNSSPRRRRNSSPVHRRASPRHRSPLRRQDSLRRGERRSPLPLRCSPTRRKRSHSPNRRISDTRRRSPCSKEKSPRLYHHLRRSKSPRHSPMDGLKRSLADSTISDDLLPQPCLGEASDSPLSSSIMGHVLKKARIALSPKRPSLDDRINQVLGVETQPSMSWKSEETQRYFQPPETMYHGYHQQRETLLAMGPSTSSMQSPVTSKVVQVGNILQVVPTEEISMPPTPQFTAAQKIVQVGNMLQIVPSEMEVILPPLPPPPPPTEILSNDSTPIAKTLPEKQSAEAILAAKNAERLAERAKKRKEKEERKKEKDKRRKEREKKRKMQLRISTEEVIKKALEMDGLIVDDNEDLSAIVPEIISDTPGLDPSKSILSNSTLRYLDPANKSERGKSVQFADGVRPGEGTSPSGGEELSSPPPQTEQLPKTKRYKKMENKRKKKKRKIKVKVVKRRQTTTESDQEFENLPPPSPPPGSPPPHVFPPRVKVHTINNIPQHYLPSFGITAAPQQQMIGQSPVLNLGYQTTGGGVYRPTQQSHMNVIGQHYTRSGHSQNVGGHMHPSPQLVHPQMASMAHREHQPFGPF
ncbi:hypothetical protein WA026_001380 [Henosepilachna vigintioctopunctata]|uniref:Uncharacterized protein n=1 Tax=Henosepilachna vigintioctopunctata TaxID=420089 RepID=A0AAW1URN5_9CUCU